MKIIQFRAENFKRLKAVEINPDGSVVVIRGENGSGKSSVIDGIWAALGSKAACPVEPIRRGEKSAVVTLDLGDLVVTRTFTPKGSELSVRSKEGAKLVEPQSVLDGMIGAVSIDPFEFARKPSREQAKILAQACGLDFAQMNTERKIAYEERTDANREVKRLTLECETRAGKVEGCDESQYESRVTLDTVIATQSAAQREHDLHKRLLDKQRDNRAYVTSKRVEVESLRDKLRQAESELEYAEAEANRLINYVDESERKLPDMDAVTNKLRNITEHNKIVEWFEELRDANKQLDAARATADALDKKIVEIDRAKQLLIEKAQLPVDGLLFDEQGIFLNGIPFEQCCASEQLKVSVALAMKLNPTIRVIRIKDGSLLDSKSMDTIRELAEAEDFQVWLEVVDESTDGPGVLIQDGSIVG